ILTFCLTCFLMFYFLHFQVLPNDLPRQISQGGTTQTAQPVEVTNPIPDAQTPSPQVEQPQPGVPLQPEAMAQFLPPTQFYTWYPLGGSPMFIPLQPISFLSPLFQMVANTGRLGVYLTSVLTSPSAVQPVNQATGLKNQGQQSIVPTVENPSAGAAATQGLQPNTNGIPAGLEGRTQVAATVQTPVQPELQATQGNLV
uniref:Odontogenic, ameloblast associated n=1 Tax=Labrus bergylta TaxID=56723 RepID=A0A3Q3G520_9LABR